MPSERDLVTHLLRRAGFGAFPDERDRWVRAGFEATLAWLLDDTRPDDPAIAALQNAYDLTVGEQVKRWWLHRMLLTRQPLRERLALFWHGHFATALRKVAQPVWLAQQIELFRTQGLGDFRELVRAVTYDRAMLRWLDLDGSHRRAPNENYARELMELFTLGHGNYTEHDVKEAARALTGWQIDRERQEVVFRPNRHDPGLKTLFGATGPWGSDDVVAIITQQPACSRFIARKLFSFFVYDDPEPAVVERFAAVLETNGMHIRALVEALLRSPEFRSERAFHAKIKAPVDFVIGALKDLNVRTLPSNLNLAAAVRSMGQDILDPPSVKGWDDGPAWLSSGWFIARCNFIVALLDGREAGRRWVEAIRLAVQTERGWDTYGLAEAFAERLLGADASVHLLELVTDATAVVGDTADRSQRDRCLRVLLSLLMTSPAYQYL